MFQSPLPYTSVVSERDTLDTILSSKSVRSQFSAAKGCQEDAFFPRVSTYPLPVAVAASTDSSFHNLHYLLLVSRRSKAAVNR